MKKKTIHCNSKVETNVSTRRMHCGKVSGVDIYTDFTVIENSCQIIRNSVMNGMLYSGEAFDELAAELMRTNKRIPAPLSHPKDQNGNPVSASDPLTFSAHNVFAFDTDWSVSGDRLLSNTYIDMSRAAENKDAQWLINSINNKLPIDRSTGLDLLVSEQSGYGQDGEPYSLYVHKIEVLDHCALLDPSREPGAKGNTEAVGMFTNADGKQEGVEEIELVTNASTPAMRLPIASRDVEWNGDAAIGRIREYTDSTEKPSSNYRKFFLYFDQSNVDDFGAYKLPFADIIDGVPMCIPAAINAIKSALAGGRGGVDISQEDKQKAQYAVDYYQGRIDKEQPQSNLNAIINKITEIFGIKPKSGYNTTVVNNTLEADPMKEKIIAALNAQGIKTDGLTDEALLAAYNAAMAPKSDKPKGKDDEEIDPKTGKPVVKPVEDKATNELLKTVNALNEKIDKLELSLNASAQKEIDDLAADVAGLNIGLTVNAAKLLPKDELVNILASNGHIAANAGGRANVTNSAYEPLPE